MNHEPAGSRQARVAQQKHASRVVKNLSEDIIVLPRSIRSPQRRFWPPAMFPTDAGLHVDRRACL